MSQIELSSPKPSPLVAVVIPTFNRRELLEQTIQSIQQQSLSDWEVLVIDDGSTDNTHDYMARVTTTDTRIRFFARESELSGANVCRNQGASQSKAELLMFLDSDDLLAPECLEHRTLWMSRNQDFDFAVCHADAFLEVPNDLNRPASKHSLEGDLERFLYFDLPWLITGPIWRREAFLKLGGFNEHIPSWQDMELHIRAILNGLRYQNLPITDYHVRWQNDPTKTSLQQRRSEHHLRCGEQTVNSFEKLLSDHSQITWTRLRGIACLRFMLAEMWGDLHRWSDSRRVWRSMKSSPANSLALFYGGLFWLWIKRMRIRGNSFVERVYHYWKGAVRLRMQPRLVTKTRSM